MELQNAKGTKDYLPEEMIALNSIMDTLRSIYERYGYNPLSTPAIERLDILSAKYAGGAEILKETFRFKDQGGRELGLRYDLTVPFARVVGQNPQLKMPFKRYQMEKVYRDGPIKAGRYREFWQCDADVVGSASMNAEAEILAIAERFFGSIGIQAVIQVNNRRIMNALLDSLGIQEKIPVILIIDKFEKQPRQELIKELLALNYSQDTASRIIDTFAQFDVMDNDGRINACARLATTPEGIQGLNELKNVLDLCATYNLKSVVFNPRLARGLAYYTSTVFEAFAVKNKITSSICGGGRYDAMIGAFLQSKHPYPAVGISFGLSTIYDVLSGSGKSTKKSVSKVFIISLEQDAYALTVAETLRSQGINAEMDIVGRSLSKNMAYVNAMGIPFAVIVGEDEVKKKAVTLKTLETGKQESLTLKQLIKTLQ